MKIIILAIVVFVVGVFIGKSYFAKNTIYTEEAWRIVSAGRQVPVGDLIADEKGIIRYVPGNDLWGIYATSSVTFGSSGTGSVVHTDRKDQYSIITEVKK